MNGQIKRRKEGRKEKKTEKQRGRGRKKGKWASAPWLEESTHLIALQN